MATLRVRRRAQRRATRRAATAAPAHQPAEVERSLYLNVVGIKEHTAVAEVSRDIFETLAGLTR